MTPLRTSHKIVCSYSVSSTMKENSEYYTLQCLVKNSFDTHIRNEEITSVESYITPDELKKYGDYYKIENVDALRFFMKDIRYFPKGIDKFFKNLVAVSITYCNLREIKQEHLNFFSKIIFLDLSVNMIEIIEKDLFKFNPLLQYIDMNNNVIKEIDGNVFDGLHSLKTLKLHSNLCVLEVAIGRHEVEKFIKELKVICMKKNQKLILDEKKDIKFNWKKYFWIILIFGTSSVVFLFYGIFKIFIIVKVSPEN